MEILNRAAALQARDLASERVSVPEWGGDVMVWQMPEGRRNDFDAFHAEQAETKDYRLFRARLVADTAGDEAGALIFSHDDVPALMEKSSDVMRRLFKVAYRLNNMGGDEDKAAVKNSEGGPDDSSPSDSQSTSASTT